MLLVMENKQEESFFNSWSKTIKEVGDIVFKKPEKEDIEDVDGKKECFEFVNDLNLNKKFPEPEQRKESSSESTVEVDLHNEFWGNLMKVSEKIDKKYKELPIKLEIPFPEPYVINIHNCDIKLTESRIDDDTYYFQLDVYNKLSQPIPNYPKGTNYVQINPENHNEFIDVNKENTITIPKFKREEVLGKRWTLPEWMEKYLPIIGYSKEEIESCMTSISWQKDHQYETIVITSKLQVLNFLNTNHLI
jgi:hypothetical protein